MNESANYYDFVFSPSNIMNCDECPYNAGHYGDYDNRKPCAQQNCWIECNCEHIDY